MRRRHAHARGPARTCRFQNPVGEGPGRHPVRACDHEAGIVARDEDKGIDAQTAGERGAQPRQRDVERHLVGERALKSGQELVAAPVTHGARSERTAQRAHQRQHHERHQPFQRGGGEARALDLGKHERRVEQHRRAGGERAPGAPNRSAATTTGRKYAWRNSEAALAPSSAISAVTRASEPATRIIIRREGAVGCEEDERAEESGSRLSDHRKSASS